MRATMWLWVMACRPDAPTEPVPTEPEACSAHTWQDGVWDCRELDPCAPDGGLQAACCDCDPALCEPQECVPFDLPPDEGPIVSFERPMWADIPTVFGEIVRVTFTPDAVLVGEDPMLAVQGSCTRDRNTFTCAPVAVPDGSGRTLRADTLQVRVVDFDGNGDADSGMIRVIGALESFFQGSNPVGARVDLMEDLLGEDAGLPSAPLPTTPVFVRLGELGLAGPAPVLRVAGVDRPLEEVAGIGGIVGYVEPDGAPLLPWGAELSLDGELADLAGNPVFHGTSQVRSDPGPWTENPGFEVGVGWASVGFDFGFPYWDPTVPYEGDGVASAYGTGTLLGHAVIPEGSTTLSFAFRSEGPTAVHATLTGITASGARTTLWELPPTAFVDCDPAFGGVCVPWTVPSVDVSGWAGDALFLELVVTPDHGPAAAPQAPPPLDEDALPQATVFVDAFQLD